MEEVHRKTSHRVFEEKEPPDTTTGDANPRSQISSRNRAKDIYYPKGVAFLKKLLEQANLEIDDAYLKRADSLIELAINAKDLYNSASPRERLKLLTELSSNRQLVVLVGARVKYSLRKSAVVLGEIKVAASQGNSWRIGRQLCDYRGLDRLPG